MTMQQFIRENRAELDQVIGRILWHVPRTASCFCPLSGTTHEHDPRPLSDTDRREWIANDEGLYNWARREGVRV